MPSIWTRWCFIRHELMTDKNSYYANQDGTHEINYKVNDRASFKIAKGGVPGHQSPQ